MNKVVNYKELPMGASKKHLSKVRMSQADMKNNFEEKVVCGSESEDNNSFEVRPEEVPVKKCDLCNNTFEGVVELKVHINKVHKRTLYNCPICEVLLFTLENYKVHFENVHMN